MLIGYARVSKADGSQLIRERTQAGPRSLPEPEKRRTRPTAPEHPWSYLAP